MKDYIYEVARIRVMENGLLTKADLEQLLAEPSFESALRALSEKGWGGGELRDAEAMLKAEEESTWALMEELLKGGRELDILRLTRDYHNLKAAIKELYASSSLAPERLYLAGGTIPLEEILQAVTDGDYEKLPPAMGEAARQASEALTRTGDAQLSDSLIDRACLMALTEAAKQAPDPVLQDYAFTTAAAADIRIALRAAAAGKDVREIGELLAPVPGLDLGLMAEAAVSGRGALADYLRNTPYEAISPSLAQSMSAFECACDDLMITRLLPQKTESLSLGPLAAYVIAREMEIKSVRLLLTGKQNGLPQEQIRESLRMCYG